MSSPNVSDTNELDELLSDAINSSLGGIVLDSDTKAPIILPSKDELAVRVVPTSSLNRLNECNDDKELTSGIFWACVGGVVGIISNMVASDTYPQKGEWLLLAILMALSLLSFLLYRRFINRATKIRDSLCNSPVEYHTNHRSNDA